LDHEKEQNHADAMQKHVDEMMPTRTEPKKLAIEHMRYGSQRMPVLRMNVGECPHNRVQGYPVADMRIFEDVKWIVIIDELMAKRLAKDRPNQRQEAESDQRDDWASKQSQIQNLNSKMFGAGRRIRTDDLLI